MPRAKRRCAKPECRNFQPCPQHPRGWASHQGPPLPQGWKKLRSTVAVGSGQYCGNDAYGTYRGYGCRTYSPVGSVDHVINRAEGGGHDITNLVWLCQVCHDEKTRTEAKRGMRRKHGKEW